MVEEFTDGNLKGQLRWLAAPPDPLLEAEFLSRLMVRLGSDEATARTALAASADAVAPRARLVAGQPTATLEVDEGFDRAWRRVGLALDRSGFTVEDRNRSEGLYFVRYVASQGGAKESPGFFSRLFGAKDEDKTQRLRLALNGSGDRTTVAVQTAEGQPVGDALGQRVAGVLVDALK